jgi:hypothetical protein
MTAYSTFKRITAAVLITAVLLIGCSDDDDNPVHSTGTWQWSALGGGLEGMVRVVEEFDGHLYASGSIQAQSYLKVLGLSGWVSPGGVDINGSVFDMIAYNDKLIVTGSFNSIGNLSVNGIAAWDGSSWSALGDGLPAGMIGNCMAVYDQKLLVGSADLYGAFSLVSWDGSSWTVVKSGGLGMVGAMCVHEGQLVVSADSTVSFGSYWSVHPWVRTWDGSSWTSMGGQTNEFHEFAVYNDTLIAVTFWSTYLHIWNGSTWQQRTGYTIENTGSSGILYTLACQDGKLIVGGNFELVDGDSCSNIVSWDGSSFSPITTGVTGPDEPLVCVLKCFHGRLIVGGRFTTAGGVEANNIAEWSCR